MTTPVRRSSTPPPPPPPPSPEQPRFRWKHLIALVVLAVVAGQTFWPGSGKEWVEIDVVEGATGRRVAEKLRQKGAIRSPYPLRFWMRVRGAHIKIGRYKFSKGRSAFWIVDDLINGRTEKVKLAIPEGFASWQIAERLEALKICDGIAFKSIVDKEQLEGFLFPATYEFEIGQGAQAVARQMVKEFEERWTPEMESRAAEIGFTRRQAVTLASIVEREVRVREEAPLVSAVYHNRLQKRMKLDADPTVQYALGHWKSRLTYADYRNTKSDYNTYLNVGLPPGPIASPGMDALKAALWPARTDAIFFVAMDDGRHDFSSTYREHVNKVNRRNRQNRSRPK